VRLKGKIGVLGVAQFRVFAFFKLWHILIFEQIERAATCIAVLSLLGFGKIK